MTITVVMLGKFVCTFFLWEGQGNFLFGIRIKFHWVGQKEGVTESMGEKPKMRVISAKFLLFRKIQTLSHNCWSDKLLITTNAIGMPKNLCSGTFK